jgi:arginine N-succinyltransferase
MIAEAPTFLIREAHRGDRRQLLQLARELDSVNLPCEPRELDDVLERSERSFRGRIRERVRAVYVFCAEEIATGKVVATSMIIGKHGTPEAPHYYLEMDSDERYSRTLGKMFRHTFLRLRYSMDGPTEIGGLIVTRAMRGHPEQLGKQISMARFLYMAEHRARFESRVIAEMLAPMTDGKGNIFWDHYGGPVTGLSFREADRLSARDKEFIRTLFPQSPLYTFLLPEDVRVSLGAVGEHTRGAVRMLEQAGMQFLNQIDPFDAGPYYGAAIADLGPVRSYRRYAAVAGTPDPGKARLHLVASEKGGFHAVRALAAADSARLVVAPAILRILKVREKARVEAIPLA